MLKKSHEKPKYHSAFYILFRPPYNTFFHLFSAHISASISRVIKIINIEITGAAELTSKQKCVISEIYQKAF